MADKIYLFPALLYQVASAFIEPSNISYTGMIAKPVQGIDTEAIGMRQRVRVNEYNREQGGRSGDQFTNPPSIDFFCAFCCG